MRWATRRHCHVDRTACAWLVARFIDPDAEFVFVDDPDEVPADATPFDMRGVEFGHHTSGRDQDTAAELAFKSSDTATNQTPPARRRPE
jgi:hypothetical protein